ncbi:hypothetical protein BDV12DRAFT_61080 [Aspergillus spectabilis]
MRVHFLLLVAYLCPVLLALVARVPHTERPEYGMLLARDTPDNTTIEASDNATSTNATSTNATNHGTTGNRTSSSEPTTVPTLNTSASDEDERAITTAPGKLPLNPAVTPALGVGGFILLATGTVLALIGVRNLWVQVFLSSAFLTSLGVTVLIVYVMSPPVRVAIQGAYLVAIFFTGVTFGALAIVFKELAEGLGCLLGGFCTSMWLLSTKSGGLLTSTDAKTGFIGAISVAFYAVSFSHYTRPYGLIVSTSIAGGTAVALGIDCYSKAGLKEFWLYLWALNDNIFPLGTNTYPVTRYIKVELAATVIVAIMGVISQLRLWKVVRDRRARDEEKRQEEQKQKDEAEADAAKRLEEHNMKERMEWEAKYGDHEATESSSSIPELAAGSHTCPADERDVEKDEIIEKKSISDSVVSYRCSDCRARGLDDADSYATGDTDCSETQHRDADETDKDTCANPAIEGPDGGYLKDFPGTPIPDDKSSDMTAIVGSETVSVYSKRFSLLSRKASVKSGPKPVSESQEALITRDEDTNSTRSVVENINDLDSDCHTIAADSHYQAMLDEEIPAPAEHKSATDTPEKPRSVLADEHGQRDESTSKSEHRQEAPQLIKNYRPHGPANEKAIRDESMPTPDKRESEQLKEPVNEKATPNESTSAPDQRGSEQPTPVETSPLPVHDTDKNIIAQSIAGQSENSREAPLTADKEVQKEPETQVEVSAESTQALQDKMAISLPDESNQSTEEPTGKEKNQEPEALEKEDPQPNKDAAAKPPAVETPEKGPHEHAKIEGPSIEKAQKQKPQPKKLNAETVEQIPKHTSRIVQTYRMNEWAKHLANADIPDLEPIHAFEEEQPDPTEQEEAAAPVKVAELLQTPLNAQLPPAVEGRAGLKDINESRHLHDSRTGSQKKKRRSKSPRRLSELSVGSAHNLSQLSPPAVQPQLGDFATPSSVTLLSHIAPVEPEREESEIAKQRWKGPAPLIAVREDMMRSRLSSLNLPTDPYARHSTGQSPTDLTPRYSSTFPIAEDDDNIPLSQRRTLLHQQASPISPSPNAHPAPPRWSVSGVPSRANSPAVLAAWRESVREDLKDRRDPLKLAHSPPPAAAGERSASPFGQLGQRNGSSTSIGDKIAEGMQRGDMSELHREALRRMQAKANQSVNRLV